MMNVQTATESLMTGDELLEMQSRTGKKFDLVKGKPIEVSPTGFRHGIIAARMLQKISNFAEERDLGYVTGAETGVYLSRQPDTVRAADVAFFSKEKFQTGNDLSEQGFSIIVPDLIVEVVSPNDTRKEVAEKASQWLAAGVRLVWIVEPQTETAQVYSTQGKQTIDAGGTLNGGEVLKGFALPLKKIF